VPQVEAVSIPNTDPPQNGYFCCALPAASSNPEQNALLLYLVVFGEFGKNFIEIGNGPKVREAMLRLRLRSRQTEFAVEEKQCKNANLEKAIWKFPRSDSAAWD
jgi:hypothetical protein